MHVFDSKMQIALLWTVLLTAAHGCSQRREPERLALLQELEGTWMPETFVASLKPQGAIPRNAFAVEIGKRDGKWGILSGNFHEGIWRSVVSVTDLGEGAYLVRTQEQAFQPGVQGKISDEKIVVRSKDGLRSTLTFAVEPFNAKPGPPLVRVAGTAEQAVAKVLVAGTYTDPQRRSYSFSSDGTARWPDAVFRYAINLDPTFVACDVFTAEQEGKKEKTFYGFAWKDGQLFLYETAVNDNDSPVTQCNKDPLVVLKPLAS